ncbi:MAG: hypothetical protein HY220_04145 [Candidatus Sungbacteria bacterium]|uniref:DNA polymerase III subunit delta n=1 Tax=Candidatus Sungiibacteriota bacterium TaxID=2750080 RepID=A0A9D6LP42_9BACT|nr:hypothetical protein [Candidatus Sungbacteria bacterium]
MNKEMILGHAKEIQYLTKACRNSRLAHGYFFYGPKDVGKLTVAKGCAAMLLCENQSKKIGGCGVCQACQRMKSETHPNLIVLSLASPFLPIAEDEMKRRSKISIEEVEAIRRRIALASKDWQIVIVEAAELLSPDAANSFLKTLEEPNEKTLFIFISSKPEYVMPTILSRLVPMRFSCPAAGELKRIPGATAELIQVSRGLPGVLISMTLDDAQKKHEQGIYRDAWRISQSTVSEALATAGNYQAAADREILLEHLFRLGESFMITGNASKSKNISKALRALETLETTNVNARLATDIIVMNLHA